MKKEVKNISASIKAKLLNYAKKENLSFNRLLTYYFQERFLYRLSISKHQNKFILKGGALLLTLDVNKGRPTQDLDFSMSLKKIDQDKIQKMIREIIIISLEDGVFFDSNSVKCSDIREGWDINALRITFSATLGTAKKSIQVDLGFKDSVIPDAVSLKYPTILELPIPLIKAYSWETVIAEKFEAMISLHILNSRLKDYYDIYYLSSNQVFHSQILLSAISETFRQRKTILKSEISVFSEEFMKSEEKQNQWESFLRKTKVKVNHNFYDIASSIKFFLEPITNTIYSKNGSFSKIWDPKKKIWLSNNK